MEDQQDRGNPIPIGYNSVDNQSRTYTVPLVILVAVLLLLLVGVSIAYYQIRTGVVVEPASFDRLRGPYTRNADGIFYHTHSRGGRIFEADPATFETIPNIDFLFAKDKNHVYYLGEILKDIEPESFVDLRELVDAATYIAVAGSNRYRKDKDAVYLELAFGRGPLPIDDADPNTFEYIATEHVGSDIDSEYGKDVKTVYRNNLVIEDANPETFEYLDKGYSTDGISVYYLGEKVEIAHGRTFVEGAHAGSFEVIMGWPGHYGRDRNHVYLEGEIIQGADPNTFYAGPV